MANVPFWALAAWRCSWMAPTGLGGAAIVSAPGLAVLDMLSRPVDARSTLDVPLSFVGVLLAMVMVFRVGPVRRWLRRHGSDRSGASAAPSPEPCRPGDRPRRGSGRSSQRRELFRDFFVNAAIPLHIFGPDRIISDMNQTELDLIGYRREEIVGRKTWSDLIVPEQRDQFERHWQELLRSGEVRNMEYTLVHKDGRRIHVLLNASARIDAVGRLLSTRGSVIDITERVEARDALRESEERFRTLVQNTPGAIYRCELEFPWRPQHISEGVLELTGHAVGEFTSGEITLGGMIHPDDVKMVSQRVAQGVAGHHAYTVEYRMRNADGDYRWTFGRGRAIYDDQGSPIWLDGVLMDITAAKRAEEILRASEERYRVFFTNSRDAFTTIDPDSIRYLSANPAMVEMFHADTEDDITSQGPLALSPELQAEGQRSAEKARELIDIAVREGSNFFEWTHRRLDGEEFPATVLLSHLDLGEQSILQATVRDITEQKHAEHALAESEQKYRNLFETAMVGLYRTSIGAGRVLEANQKFAEIMGYRDVEELKQGFVTSEHYADSERREELLRRIAEDGFVDDFEIAVRRKDDSIIQIAVSSSAYPDRGFLEGAILDMTDRKRAEDALRASEASYRSIFDSVTDGIMVHDIETGKPLDVNESYMDMLGYSREALLSMCVEDWSVDPDCGQTTETVREKIRMTVEDGPQTFEWRFRRKDGKLRWAEVNLKVAAIAGCRRLLAVVHDITERKEVEAERRRIEEQMQHAQKLESLGVLAGGIAHDFNNLLVAILGNADLALMDMGPNDPERASIEEIKQAAKRASDLTNQMLAYSGKGRFVVGPVDLNALVGEMGRLLNVSISKKAEMRYDLAEDLPVVEADASQMRQVVMNLITNASDAIGAASGCISLRTSVVDADRRMLAGTYLGRELPEGRYVCLEVADTGCGMDEENLSRLFEPFYSTKFSGRGLGLAAVLGIVRGHHGSIRVESKPGEGSTFDVYFPASEMSAKPSVAAANEQKAEPAGGGTVLVVDDESSVREIAAIMLRRSGFTVLTAADGEEAVKIFGEQGDIVDVVLLDMTMPRMGGLETLQAMRAMRNDVSVILTSGYGKESATEELTGESLAGFIQKPFEMGVLVDRIREVLSP